MGISPDGSMVFVTGDSNTRPDTVAYDAHTGARVWQAQFRPGYSDYTRALAVSPDGSRVFVTGAYSAYLTVAYDASTGAQLWSKRYNPPGNVGYDTAQAIGVSPDGSTVFVTGYGNNPDGYWQTATVAYDAATGYRLWVADYQGSYGSLGGFDLAVSPDGTRVFVTGSRYDSDFSTDFATLAYDAATGTQLWLATYDGPGGYDSASEIGVSPDGSKVFVSGSSSEVGSTIYDYATVAYDAAGGTQLWVTRYDGPQRADDYPHDLGVGPGGTAVYVTGDSGSEYGTVAYDAATGDELWATEYPLGESQAYALAAKPDGGAVYVTGESMGSHTNFDIATIAYDPSTGNQLWAAVAGRNGDDVGSAIGVSPDGGSVYVAGNLGVSGWSDYVTIAYTG
jgi:DNA-binding beta-propeller fold protein YncE